jgi:FkbM family methyltransferase
MRSYLRRILRRYGRAAVVTVHERLNVVEDRLNSLAYQNEEIASTQTALLQSQIHLVEAQAEEPTKTELAVVRASLERSLDAVQPSLARILGLQTQDRKEREADFAAVQASLDRVLSRYESLAHSITDYLATQSVRQVCVETSDYASINPEVGLMAFLYSFLPSRNAIDVGAHTGEVTQYLLNAGYDVYAFEPYPPTYARLTTHLNGQGRFHSFQLALGSTTGEAELHLASDSTDDRIFDDPTVFHSLLEHGMPDGLAFEESVSVPLQTLAHLHHDGTLPLDVSLVKIDTEGYDLEVIRGMGDHRYAVVTVEFWDAQIPFANGGLQYSLDAMVSEMRERGYFWYIVIYRVWGQNQIAFFCNHERPVPNSWGNIFFFQERETFLQAQQWCAAVLPRTYFRPVEPTAAIVNHLSADPSSTKAS